MVRFIYNGDDRCPRCKALYCASCDHWPQPEDEVTCMGCGYKDKLEEFIKSYYEMPCRVDTIHTHPDAKTPWLTYALLAALFIAGLWLLWR